MQMMHALVNRCGTHENLFPMGTLGIVARARTAGAIMGLHLITRRRPF
jgi:hypothetical protein